MAQRKIHSQYLSTFRLRTALQPQFISKEAGNTNPIVRTSGGKFSAAAMPAAQRFIMCRADQALLRLLPASSGRKRLTITASRAQARQVMIVVTVMDRTSGMCSPSSLQTRFTAAMT